MFDRIRDLLRTGLIRLRGGGLTPQRAALSVAFGLLVGCTPVYGLQTLICIGAGLLLRLDVPLILFATLIANPFTAPFLVALEMEIGALLVTGKWVTLRPSELSVAQIGSAVGYAMLGGVAVGLVTGLFGGFGTFYWVRRRQRP